MNRPDGLAATAAASNPTVLSHPRSLRMALPPGAWPQDAKEFHQ